MEKPVTTMKRPLPGWESADHATGRLLTWRDSAFTAAMEKFHTSHENIETVLQTGEAFGRAIFHTYLEKTQEWDLDQWCMEVTQILSPFGDAFEITGGQHDMVAAFLRRHPLAHLPREKPLESLFTYGTLRGLFLSAFPHGELVVSPQPSEEEHPGALIFKLHPSSLDRLTRERVKDAYSVMKRHEHP